MGQTLLVRAGRGWQHTGGGGCQTHLAEEEKPQKGKAEHGKGLAGGDISVLCPSARTEDRRHHSGQAVSGDSSQQRVGR